jgi:hypothetical protein
MITPHQEVAAAMNTDAPDMGETMAAYEVALAGVDNPVAAAILASTAVLGAKLDSLYDAVDRLSWTPEERDAQNRYERGY